MFPKTYLTPPNQKIKELFTGAFLWNGRKLWLDVNILPLAVRCSSLWQKVTTDTIPNFKWDLVLYIVTISTPGDHLYFIPKNVLWLISRMSKYRSFKTGCDKRRHKIFRSILQYIMIAAKKHDLTLKNLNREWMNDTKMLKHQNGLMLKL